MCPTKSKQKQKHRLGHVASDHDESTADDPPTAAPYWRDEAINGGSVRHVDLETGSNGWSSPPGHLFHLRSKTYLTSKKNKIPSGPWLLSPAGFDWLKSPAKLDHVLSRADNRVMHALKKSQYSLKTFLVAVNLQIPGRDHYSAVFYFSTDEPIQSNSLLHRFITEDDDFRNSRFKIVSRIVKGPWIVKAAVGNYAACLLGKALTCRYFRGENYLEIDVDIGSSAIANAVLKLALGYVTAVTVDMGFVVEAQAEEELPERLFGAVRVCQMEMSAATVVDTVDTASLRRVKGGSTGCCNQMSQSRVGVERSDGGDDEVDVDDDA